MEQTIDPQTLGLAIAVAYPTEAFSGGERQVVELAGVIVERAGRGEHVAAEVEALLGQHPHLNEWVTQVLEDPQHRPPHLQPDVVRSPYEPMPGEPGPVRSKRFACPLGDGFVWHQRSVADPIPPCPLCGSALVAI